MKLVDRIKQIKWDEGVELLEFCIMMPFVFTIILFSLDIFVTMRAGQTAEYYAYAGARAAAVTSQSNNTSTGEPGDTEVGTRIGNAYNAAKMVVEGGLNTAGFTFVKSEGTETELNVGECTQTLEVLASDSGSTEWIKGELLKYTITVNAPRFINFRGDEKSRTISSSIVMMIESPIANPEDRTK